MEKYSLVSGLSINLFLGFTMPKGPKLGPSEVTFLRLMPRDTNVYIMRYVYPSGTQTCWWDVIYIMRYVYPSGTQTCCWDVIYNTFLSYITFYITRKVLYSSFFGLYNGVRPVVGINHTFCFGYVSKNWRHNQLCCSLRRGKGGT